MVFFGQEASPSHVASAATLSVAFMEALSAVFQSFGHNYKWVNLSPTLYLCFPTPAMTGEEVETDWWREVEKTYL